MDPSPPPQDRLTRTLEREVVHRKRLTAALVLASCAVTLVSVVTLRSRKQLQRDTAELAACELTCVEAPAVGAAAGFFVPARTLPVEQPVDDLLDAPLEVLCPEGDIRGTTLDGAAVAGAVHLVNLWQLSCPGCLREFPLLGRALERADGVRFLPVDDSGIRVPVGDYRTAQSRHDMPGPDLALIDRGPDGARLLPAVAPLVGDNPVVYPFTFVLDCEKKLRWWKLGALAESEVDALSALLVHLRTDDACRADAPRPTVCRERRPAVGRRELQRREKTPDPAPPPAAPDVPPSTSTSSEEPDDASQHLSTSDAAAEPPLDPSAPLLDPAPEPPRSYRTREACQLYCLAERHTCQIASEGHYLCAPPPAPI